MFKPEICALTALSPNGRVISDPWQYIGFCELAKIFLRDHPALLGIDEWEIFPFKDMPSITPWILTDDYDLQMSIRSRYPHVRFTDSVDLLKYYVPLKGLWWIIGGLTLFSTVEHHLHSIEATVVESADGDFSISYEQFKIQHTCPHPLAKGFKCVRYERNVSPIHMHSL